MESPDEIRKAATDYFKNFFTEKHSKRPTFDNLNFKNLSHDQAHSLTLPFSKEEIDAAVSSCASDKAPGPDGLNFRFIKSAWEIIKPDIYSMVEKFWESATLPHGSNVAFISLIPKKDFPNGFHDYRPISMVGCLYKIIAKLLARRIQLVIGSVISPFQSSFVKGRQILDGALIASEIIDSCKKKKLPAVILKLDFHKAFDSVSWNFLEWSLSQMGFPLQWVKWIKACVNSASASILVNGSPTPPIKHQKGLRQGDPLSPFLFDIIAESLHLLFEKATSHHLWEGIEIAPGGLKISHLQYADDTIIFCPPNLEFLQNVKKTLILFHLASGLQVNFSKSSIMGINVPDHLLDTMAENLLCARGSLPFLYLGLPIGGSTSQLSTWDPIIQKVEKKLASWRGKVLSLGGRLTLLKSSLASLPLYYMSLFPVPQGIIKNSQPSSVSSYGMARARSDLCLSSNGKKFNFLVC